MSSRLSGRLISHDVRAPLLAFGADFHQPHNPSHAPHLSVRERDAEHTPDRRRTPNLATVRGASRQAAIAASVNQTVRLPRWRRAASYSAQLVTRCRCLGMWRRQAALALNGTTGIQASGKGLSSYAAPLPTPTGRSVQQCPGDRDRLRRCEAQSLVLLGVPPGRRDRPVIVGPPLLLPMIMPAAMATRIVRAVLALVQVQQAVPCAGRPAPSSTGGAPRPRHRDGGAGRCLAVLIGEVPLGCLQPGA